MIHLLDIIKKQRPQKKGLQNVPKYFWGKKGKRR